MCKWESELQSCNVRIAYLFFFGGGGGEEEAGNNVAVKNNNNKYTYVFGA